MRRRIVATFLTTHFGEWKGMWHGGGGTDSRRSGTPILEPIPPHNAGALAVFDYDSGEVLWSMELDTPAGFAFDENHLYLNSMYGNRILIFDRNLQVVDSLSVRLMNDLHSLVFDGTSFLLTSSGVDAVLRLDRGGEIQWGWYGSERAYRRNPRGFMPRIDKQADYRTAAIQTMDQTTHCNSAVPAVVGGRSVVLVSLFHQGEIIAIDNTSKDHEIVVTGIGCPHSIRRRHDGWLVSDSRSGGVVLLDDQFWVKDFIEADFDWVQDAIELEDEVLLIADANHSRLVEWNVQQRRAEKELHYPKEWKVYQIDILDDTWSRYVEDVVAATG